jgi:hypothetical protein
MSGTGRSRKADSASITAVSKELHPAENRSLREVYLFGRNLVHHWTSLASRLPHSPLANLLTKGAESVRELIHELEPLTAEYGLYGQPAAQGGGVTLARQRNILRDRFLEVNQAVRFAVEDLQHVVTLLGYVNTLAASRGHTDLAELAARWERKLRRLENEVRRAAMQLGSDPDAAIERLDSSKLGRVAHGAGNALGTVGEWVDRKAAERRGS